MSVFQAYDVESANHWDSLSVSAPNRDGLFFEVSVHHYQHGMSHGYGVRLTRAKLALHLRQCYRLLEKTK